MRPPLFLLVLWIVIILISCQCNHTENEKLNARPLSELSVKKDSINTLIRHASIDTVGSKSLKYCDCNVNVFFSTDGEGSSLAINFKDLKGAYINLDIYKGHITGYDGKRFCKLDVVYTFSDQPIYLTEISWANKNDIIVHSKKDTTTLYTLPDKQSKPLIRFGETYNLPLLSCRGRWLEVEVWVYKRKYTGWMENKFAKFDYDN
jgi:hypothetical protein